MNMNVSLPEELANFVKDKVSTGRYGSSSEIVREALRLMEKTERRDAEKLALLRQAWKEGVDSGDVGEVDFTALKKEARARLAAAKREIVSRVPFTRRAREAIRSSTSGSPSPPEFGSGRRSRHRQHRALACSLSRDGKQGAESCESSTARATCLQSNGPPSERCRRHPVPRQDFRTLDIVPHVMTAGCTSVKLQEPFALDPRRHPPCDR